MLKTGNIDFACLGGEDMEAAFRRITTIDQVYARRVAQCLKAALARRMKRVLMALAGSLGGRQNDTTTAANFWMLQQFRPTETEVTLCQSKWDSPVTGVRYSMSPLCLPCCLARCSLVGPDHPHPLCPPLCPLFGSPTLQHSVRRPALLSVQLSVLLTVLYSVLLGVSLNIPLGVLLSS